MKRTITLILALLLVLSAVFTLAACGKKTGGDATEAAAGTTAGGGEAAAATTTHEATAAATTTDKWEVLGPEVAALDAVDRQFTVEFSQFVAPEKIAKNRQYLQGPDAIEDGVTPTIEQMIYERNLAAKNTFGTEITYIEWDHDKASWGRAAGQIQTLVQGNAADAPDLFVNMIYDLNLVLKTVGAFKDVWSLPGSYFDFSTEGWMTDWMNSMSITGDRAYVLAGDYFLDVLRTIGVLPFNMTMMDANANKLAMPLIGEELAEGEELTPLFFDLVEEGKWTWELLGKLCEAIWVDTDGDGADSVRDQLGIIADEYGGVSSSIYIYSCGEELIERKVIEDEADPNCGKEWVYYPKEPGVLNDIFDSVAAVFSGSGSLSTRSSLDGATADNPGLAYHHIKFGQGELLTAGACLLGELEDDSFQQMQDQYSVVPLPKVNTESDYNTFITNTGDAGAINVNTAPNRAKVISAYVQYCTENSADIREEFLEIVTKYKTTTYNQGTDRMLDLIYEHINYGGVKVIEDAVNGNYRWHVMMKDGGKFLYTSADLATMYESAIQAKQTALNSLLTTWYSLPKIEQTEESAE